MRIITYKDDNKDIVKCIELEAKSTSVTFRYDYKSNPVAWGVNADGVGVEHELYDHSYLKDGDFTVIEHHVTSLPKDCSYDDIINKFIADFNNHDFKEVPYRRFRVGIHSYDEETVRKLWHHLPDLVNDQTEVFSCDVEENLVEGFLYVHVLYGCRRFELYQLLAQCHFAMDYWPDKTLACIKVTGGLPDVDVEAALFNYLSLTFDAYAYTTRFYWHLNNVEAGKLYFARCVDRHVPNNKPIENYIEIEDNENRYITVNGPKRASVNEESKKDN